jgi:uncharacterized protein (TIGR02453 family)
MFTRKTVSFLRSLKRNNNREWFRAHKEDYERHVRGPMSEVVARLAVDMRSFAPELIADPKVSLFRPYRDTRFSSDKSPIKTAVGARFPSRQFARGEGAGLYFEVAPGWVWIGGGMYMPSSADLNAIREEITSSHPRLHRLVTSPAFKRACGEMIGDRLTRVPRGYAKDNPAANYLQFKQFLGASEYEASFATSPGFYRELLRVFKAVTPLVKFLNQALLERLTQAPILVDEPTTRDLRRSAPLLPAAAPMW